MKSNVSSFNIPSEEELRSMFTENKKEKKEYRITVHLKDGTNLSTDVTPKEKYDISMMLNNVNSFDMIDNKTKREVWVPVNSVNYVDIQKLEDLYV